MNNFVIYVLSMKQTFKFGLYSKIRRVQVLQTSKKEKVKKFVDNGSRFGALEEDAYSDEDKSDIDDDDEDDEFYFDKIRCC